MLCRADSDQNWIFYVAQKFDKTPCTIVHGLWLNFAKTG